MIVKPGSRNKAKRREREKEPGPLNQELRARLIKLFEKYFFIVIVAVEAKI